MGVMLVLGKTGSGKSRFVIHRVLVDALKNESDTEIHLIHRFSSEVSLYLSSPFGSSIRQWREPIEGSEHLLKNPTSHRRILLIEEGSLLRDKDAKNYLGDLLINANQHQLLVVMLAQNLMLIPRWVRDISHQCLVAQFQNDLFVTREGDPSPLGQFFPSSCLARVEILCAYRHTLDQLFTVLILDRRDQQVTWTFAPNSQN